MVDDNGEVHLIDFARSYRSNSITSQHSEVLQVMCLLQAIEGQNHLYPGIFTQEMIDNNTELKEYLAHNLEFQDTALMVAQRLQCILSHIDNAS